MVTGFTKFKERFHGFEEQYVVIGGTACDLLMENEDMVFRATKDIDIVLIVESITAEFGKAFWEYIKEAEYEHKNKSTGNTQFYRFTSPKSKEYPFMIEIFSKKPEFIVLDENAALTPLPIDDEISSLSAILLNDVFRLSQLITAESKQALDKEIAADMKRFLNEMEKETIDLKALGIRGFTQKSMISLLRNCYGIE